MHPEALLSLPKGLRDRTEEEATTRGQPASLDTTTASLRFTRDADPPYSPPPGLNRPLPPLNPRVKIQTIDYNPHALSDCLVSPNRQEPKGLPYQKAVRQSRFRRQ
ncbi:MAG: hypothetical protein KDJ52_09975, partial [Anaerolineae bacterium]|nr:hypothetical protein [Anaerolineae bacterium]